MSTLTLTSSMRRTVEVAVSPLDRTLTTRNKADRSTQQEYQVRTFTKAQAEDLRDFLNREYPVPAKPVVSYMGLDLGSNEFTYKVPFYDLMAQPSWNILPPAPPKEGTYEWFIAEADRLDIGPWRFIPRKGEWHVSGCGVCRRLRNEVREARAAEEANKPRDPWAEHIKTCRVCSGDPALDPNL